MNINLGDKIKASGTLSSYEENSIFNLFNYKKYMLSKKTYYKMHADNITILKKNTSLLYELKKYIINRIDKLKTREYLYSFILGYNNYIKKNIKTSYRINGISHLFSISGSHISLISTIILFILNKIKKGNINYIITMIFLFIFSFLTGFSLSVIRSLLFFILYTFNRVLNFNIKNYKIFILCFTIAIIINPFSIYNIGFKFSYIVSFYLIIFNLLIRRCNTYIKKIFITSLIAFMSSIPILINNYFSINLLTIFNNMIFVPLISIIIFPMAILVLFIPILDNLYIYLINILEQLNLFISNYKIEIILSKINIFFIIYYYILITFILYKFIRKKYIYILLLFITILIHNNINLFKKDSFVTYLDVMQGDSTFVKLNKSNILIDTGGVYNKNIIDNTISYLKSNGIKRINYLIITHGDFDHMGEAINLVNNFKVKNVIFNCGEFNELEKELIKVLDKKKIKYYSCIKELNIDNNKLYFLQTKYYDNENDNSNVIYTELDGYKFMFMGDAEADKEKDILDKYNLRDIDVLKVGHHGSKTSSSKSFINEANPKYSIISVGKNNRYGHPNKEALNNLEDSKVYRTDQDGNIIFKIKNNKLKIKTCSP